MALWRILFLAEKYGRMTLFLDEIAEQIGLAPATIKNRRSAGDFAPMHVVREILGHTSIKTTERYAHVLTQPQRTALEGLGAAVDFTGPLHRPLDRAA